jgi:hypothetical protein
MLRNSTRVNFYKNRAPRRPCASSGPRDLSHGVTAGPGEAGAPERITASFVRGGARLPPASCVAVPTPGAPKARLRAARSLRSSARRSYKRRGKKGSLPVVPSHLLCIKCGAPQKQSLSDWLLLPLLRTTC